MTGFHKHWYGRDPDWILVIVSAVLAAEVSILGGDCTQNHGTYVSIPWLREAGELLCIDSLFCVSIAYS